MSLALGVLGGITWGVGIVKATGNDPTARWPATALVLFGLAACAAAVILR